MSPCPQPTRNVVRPDKPFTDRGLLVTMNSTSVLPGPGLVCLTVTRRTAHPTGFDAVRSQALRGFRASVRATQSSWGPALLVRGGTAS